MDPRSLLVLLLALLRGISAGGGDVLAAIGSSVLLDPEHGANLSDSRIEWTFNNSNGTLVTILDYVPNSPVEKPYKDFKSRLRFNASNGSVMVDSLKLSDQGVYTITVNSTWKRSIDLKLIESLSEPSIINNSTCVDTAIQLICQLSGGKENSIVWWKDNKTLMSSQYYQLVQNNSTLIISEAQASDCGTYTCTVENSVSQNSTSYSLKLRGLTRLHHSILAFSVAALVTPGVILITAVAICLDKILHVNKDSKTWLPFIREKMRHLLKFAPVLSLLFFSIACVCWILTEVCLDMPHTLTSLSQLIANTIPIVHIIGHAGHSGINVVLSMSWILHLTVVLSNCRFIRDKPMLNKIISNKSNLLFHLFPVCRFILNVAAPAIAVFGPSILIREVMKQTDSDCGSAAILQSTIILTVVMTLVILVVTFVPYKICSEWKKQPIGIPPASTSFGDSDQHQYTELKKTPSSPGHKATLNG